MGNLNSLTSISSASTVAKRETTQEGGHVSARGKRIKIGGHIDYPYGIEQVMLSKRGEPGDDTQSAHSRPLGSRDYTPVYTGKKDSQTQANINLG